MKLGNDTVKFNREYIGWDYSERELPLAGSKQKQPNRIIQVWRWIKTLKG